MEGSTLPERSVDAGVFEHGGSAYLVGCGVKRVVLGEGVGARNEAVDMCGRTP